MAACITKRFITESAPVLDTETAFWQSRIDLTHRRAASQQEVLVSQSMAHQKAMAKQINRGQSSSPIPCALVNASEKRPVSHIRAAGLQGG